jgi:hypothetical protein
MIIEVEKIDVCLHRINTKPLSIELLEFQLYEFELNMPISLSRSLARTLVISI